MLLVQTKSTSVGDSHERKAELREPCPCSWRLGWGRPHPSRVWMEGEHWPLLASPLTQGLLSDCVIWWSTLYLSFGLDLARPWHTFRPNAQLGHAPFHPPQPLSSPKRGTCTPKPTPGTKEGLKLMLAYREHGRSCVLPQGCALSSIAPGRGACVWGEPQGCGLRRPWEGGEERKRLLLLLLLYYYYLQLII